MKIYRNYSFNNHRIIWRLIPAGENRLLIEERDAKTHEVFFTCIEMNSGRVILKDYQPEEKLWCGVEKVYKGIILFHKYAKPDMPTHSGIIAFSIDDEKIVWKSDLSFLFIAENNVYGYINLFEGKRYFKLDYLTGGILSELGEDYDTVNRLAGNPDDGDGIENYQFPEVYYEGRDPSIDGIITDIKNKKTVAGRINFLKKGSLLCITFHTVNDNGTLTNLLVALEIDLKRIILEELLNNEINSFIPDSFFLADDQLFVLIEKEELAVYLITE